MASFEKRSGGWRVFVAIKGVRESATFATKAEAAAWAAERETAIRKTVQTGIIAGKTLQDAFERYEQEVSTHKKGHRWEAIRMTAIARYGVNGVNLGSMKLTDITPSVLGAWRDQRISVDGVSGSTVNREIKLLSHIFTTAKREWRWMSESPTKDVRRPKEAAHRDRLISDDEIERICNALGFDGGKAKTKSACAAVAFMFALETAMRAGEICGLTREDVKGRVATLQATKNGSRREVPLSTKALELIELLPEDGTTLFNVSGASLDVLFRKARDRCEIENLTFHDTRHEAITRLAKKLNVLELARTVGHKDLKMLQIYYNETAENLADKLD